MQLYFDSINAIIKFDGQPSRLDHKTFQLLCYFVGHQDQVIERHALMQLLWQNQNVSDASLDRLISVLRKLLGVNDHKFIFTIHKTGYRFVIPDDVCFIAVKPTVANEVSINEQPPIGIKNPRLIGRRWSLVTGFLLLVSCLSWLLFPGSGSLLGNVVSAQPGKSATKAATKSAAIERIAVLPFEQLAQQVDGELFAEGLVIELVNNLTQIKGLTVVDPHRSLKFSSNTADLQQVATALDVRYLLKGNIRKQGNKLRVGVQMVDSHDGSTLFSTVYECQLSDGFAMQINIALEVAAALRLTLYHQQDDGTFAYSSALKRLDHISVEKLVIARAQVKRYRREPINRAIKSLNELDQAYPHTPEILGLLAYANSMYSSVSSFKAGHSRTIERDLALAALDLDKTNLDALITLYYYYHDYAEFQGHSKQIAMDIVNFYPGSTDSQSVNFYQHRQNLGSCQQLQAVADNLSPAKSPDKQLSAFKTVISNCIGYGNLSSDDPQTQAMIDRVVFDFGLFEDSYYQKLQKFAEHNPNQRFLTELYCRQLSMGAEQMASDTRQRLGELSLGYWQFYVAQCSYSNNRSTTHLPSDYVDFIGEAFNNNTRLAFVSTLIKQFRQNEGDINVQVLTDYLNKVPAFPIALTTRKQALGLIMLQYHTEKNNKKNSRNTAKQLLLHLSQYQKKHPDAYRFWSLGHVHFAAALYANEMGKAAEILDYGFAAHTTYWLQDQSMMSEVLLPWRDHPLVTNYLQRIDADAERVRLKLGLY